MRILFVRARVTHVRHPPPRPRPPQHAVRPDSLLADVLATDSASSVLTVAHTLRALRLEGLRPVQHYYDLGLIFKLPPRLE